MRRGLFASIRSLFLLGLLLVAVTLWPVRTSPTRHRQTSLELRCARSEFHAASFSPDGTKVATGESAGYVRLWDADTGTDLGSFEGHTGLVTVVAFSPGGEHVASGSQDGTARIWDIRSGACLATLEGHGFQVQVARNPRNSLESLCRGR
jgi:WD40 repeat protein